MLIEVSRPKKRSLGRSVMRGGGKKWLEIGDDMVFGCDLGLWMCFCVCGVKTCILCAFGSQMCVLTVALCMK